MKKEERFRGLASLFQFVKSKILRSHMILPWLCVSVSVELIISRYWSSDPKMKTMSKLDSWFEHVRNKFSNSASS
ncbi:unnamed protein product [Arabidopsis halleri]